MNKLERLSRIQPPVVKRAAGDGAFEFLGPRRQQRLNVLDRGQAPRSDYGNRNGLRQSNGGVPVDAFEQTVARDIGIDDGGDAGVLEAARDVERGQFRRLRPAFNRDLAIACATAVRSLPRRARTRR